MEDTAGAMPAFPGQQQLAIRVAVELGTQSHQMLNCRRPSPSEDVNDLLDPQPAGYRQGVVGVLTR
jgi:hypothetical protein